MNTRGVLAGSFDPITRGHEWLVKEAARLVDELDVVIAANPTKKYTFDDATRERLVRAALDDLELPRTKLRLHFLPHKKALVKFADSLGATHLIRGIRNLQDFSYETNLALINKELRPEVRTVFLVTPPELTQVSSSTVKSLVGLEDWEADVQKWVHPAVLEAFRQLEANKQ